MSEVQPGILEHEGKRGMLAPTIIVIFGATGDLSQKKLLPALFHLFCAGYLPAALRIVGFSRRDLGDEGYRSFARDALAAVAGEKKTELEHFLGHLTYISGDFMTPDSYQKLSDGLIVVEGEMGQCANKLFYLAVPPASYEPIFKELADSGLTIPCSDELGWTRVLVEKPFGNDNDTAAQLDCTLGLLFNESQIFRIDHYLAKEALQDILMFRFSNLIFEPLWNKQYVDRVEIKLFESHGIEARGAFYDGLGALRDVGQNHLLQMLALVAMENPGGLDATAIREARAKVLEALRPIRTGGDAAERTVRGQYLGYLDEPGVAAASQTETYFRIQAFVDNQRWRDVPFYIESGKMLERSLAEIVITFKDTGVCLCRPEDEHHHANILTFRIQPDEGISVLFWAKQRGFTSQLEPKKLAFSYREEGSSSIRIPDAYERVLYDGIAGDQILFTSTDEVMAAWKFITPIIEHWQDTPLRQYEKGSTGPRVS